MNEKRHSDYTRPGVEHWWENDTNNVVGSILPSSGTPTDDPWHSQAA